MFDYLILTWKGVVIFLAIVLLNAALDTNTLIGNFEEQNELRSAFIEQNYKKAANLTRKANLDIPCAYLALVNQINLEFVVAFGLIVWFILLIECVMRSTKYNDYYDRS